MKRNIKDELIMEEEKKRIKKKCLGVKGEITWEENYAVETSASAHHRNARETVQCAVDVDSGESRQTRREETGRYERRDRREEERGKERKEDRRRKVLEGRS